MGLCYIKEYDDYSIQIPHSILILWSSENTSGGPEYFFNGYYLTLRKR